MKNLLFLLAICIACSAPKQEEKEGSKAELLKFMTGSFSSEQQSISDTNYYHISLHMASIWPNSEKSYFYVEQALGTMQERPYRQRIYLVEDLGDGKFSSAVYAMEADSIYIGKWKTPDFFDQFDESILVERNGCAVFLEKREDGIYAGSTRERECESKLRGASYATSIVEIGPEAISSWDQGFDSLGQQVWGATEGPYIFDRIK